MQKSLSQPMNSCPFLPRVCAVNCKILVSLVRKLRCSGATMATRPDTIFADLNRICGRFLHSRPGKFSRDGAEKTAEHKKIPKKSLLCAFGPLTPRRRDALSCKNKRRAGRDVWTERETSGGEQQSKILQVSGGKINSG